MLTTLYNVFSDEVGLHQFSFANADLHARANEALFTNYGVQLPWYVLDPIATSGEGLQNWLQSHQESHNQLNSLLGIAGNDISEVDFKNPEQLAAWIWLHAQEHVQISQKLGVF